MPQWNSWADVPVGEQNWITGLVDQWDQSIGFQITFGPADLLYLANSGIETLHDLGQMMSGNPDPRYQKIFQDMPWAVFGLDKDTYAQMSSTFGTEYKKITGQDISKEALQQAFQNPRDQSGGLLTASQYAQQLMNDANIQKTFGWVKYGLDFSQWTQQKLSLRTAFGRDINDTEAATILQYQRPTSGSNVSAIARASGQQAQQPEPGVAGSFAR